MGIIHHANIKTSYRLQRTLKVLHDGNWHGTRDIQQQADVCAVNSNITELRCNGFDILTRCVGRGRYEYQLQSEGLN